MEVGDSVSSTLQKIFMKNVCAALKSSIPEKKEKMDESAQTIIHNATEVCFCANLRRFFCNILYNYEF